MIGLPVEAAGGEGTMAAAAREWAAAIGERLALPVTLRDERLSSFEAERRLGRMPRGRSGGPPSRTQRNAYRARIDREAASVILQDELDARRAVGPSSGDGGADEHPGRPGPARLLDGGYRNGYQRPAATAAVRVTSASTSATGAVAAASPGSSGSSCSSRSCPRGVLLVMVTVARPLVRAVVVPWADDNPAALRIPFVADMVREDIGAALTAPASGSADEITFLVQEGDTPRDDRAPPRRGGHRRERAGIPVPGPRGGPRDEAHRRAAMRSPATSRRSRSWTG